MWKHQAEVDRLEEAGREESLVLRPSCLLGGGREVLQYVLGQVSPDPSTIKGERRLPERRGRQCTRGWREPSRWQTCLLHPEPSPRLQPLVRESIIRANQFGTERPGRESARRDAVRLDVRPAPTSSTDPPAILATRTHSETKMSDQPQLAEHIPKPSSQPRLTLKFCRFRNFRATIGTNSYISIFSCGFS